MTPPTVVVGEQTVDEVAPDEPGPADEEHATVHRDASLSGATPTSSGGALSAGWLTSRCQTTAHRPSVCGVTRSSLAGGMTTQASATRRV